MSYADVNGLSLYYEDHGSGTPLVLLHGGLGGGEMWGPILPQLAKNHRVIPVDLQGHGHTADVNRLLRHETTGELQRQCCPVRRTTTYSPRPTWPPRSSRS